jgi:mannitol-specific phosphotransferase system IIBC component
MFILAWTFCGAIMWLLTASGKVQLNGFDLPGVYTLLPVLYVVAVITREGIRELPFGFAASSGQTVAPTGPNSSKAQAIKNSTSYLLSPFRKLNAKVFVATVVSILLLAATVVIAISVNDRLKAAEQKAKAEEAAKDSALIKAEEISKQKAATDKALTQCKDDLAQRNDALTQCQTTVDNFNQRITNLNQRIQEMSNQNSNVMVP